VNFTNLAAGFQSTAWVVNTSTYAVTGLQHLYCVTGNSTYQVQFPAFISAIADVPSQPPLVPVHGFAVTTGNQLCYATCQAIVQCWTDPDYATSVVDIFWAPVAARIVVVTLYGVHAVDIATGAAEYQTLGAGIAAKGAVLAPPPAVANQSEVVVITDGTDMFRALTVTRLTETWTYSTQAQYTTALILAVGQGNVYAAVYQGTSYDTTGFIISLSVASGAYQQISPCANCPNFAAVTDTGFAFISQQKTSNGDYQAFKLYSWNNTTGTLIQSGIYRAFTATIYSPPGQFYYDISATKGLLHLSLFHVDLSSSQSGHTIYDLSTGNYLAFAPYAPADMSLMVNVVVVPSRRQALVVASTGIFTVNFEAVDQLRRQPPPSTPTPPLTRAPNSSAPFTTVGPSTPDPTPGAHHDTTNANIVIGVVLATVAAIVVFLIIVVCRGKRQRENDATIMPLLGQPATATATNNANAAYTAFTKSSLPPPPAPAAAPQPSVAEDSDDDDDGAADDDDEDLWGPQSKRHMAETAAITGPNGDTTVASTISASAVPMSVLVPPNLPKHSLGAKLLASCNGGSFERLTQFPLIVTESHRIAAAKHRSNNPHALSEDEIFAVVLYTYDLGPRSTQADGSDNFYFVVNDVIRKAKKEGPAVLEPLKEYFECFDSVWHKLPQVRGRYFRGVPRASWAMVRGAYHVGRPIEWTAITSVSKNARVAERFAAKDGAGGIVFDININDARDVALYSAVPAEEEVILSPNTQFTVASEPTAAPQQPQGVGRVELVQVAKDTLYSF
jgi:hypothetical protein